MTKHDVEQYLKGLDELQLLHLLNDILKDRRDDKFYDNGDFQYDDVFCIAACSYGSNDNELDPEAIVELYAPVVTEESASERGICNYAECESCKTSLISEGKVANCPVCKTKNFLT